MPREHLRDDERDLEDGSAVALLKDRLSEARAHAECERSALLASVADARQTAILLAHRLESNGRDRDHACAECVPYSDILVSGFRCSYHTAIAWERAERDADEGLIGVNDVDMVVAVNGRTGPCELTWASGCEESHRCAESERHAGPHVCNCGVRLFENDEDGARD